MDLPVEEAAMFKEAFNSYDKNHDGLLSKAEFREFFKHSGHNFTDKQINFFFRSVKPNAVGYIDFNGFLELLFVGDRCLQPMTVAEHLFFQFDRDNDGYIEYNEFREMMADLYDKDAYHVEAKIRQDFNNVDADASGRITLKEMAKILEAHI